MFTNNDINFEALKRKAYNGRWATLEDGIIPLTAADPDFRMSKEIENGIIEYIKDGYLSYGPFSGIPEFKKAWPNTLMLRKRKLYPGKRTGRKQCRPGNVPDRQIRPESR
uniref:Uncharacterized protein n=1 Tax=Chryseobacterium endophyticum TaxID=1854762 RepID=A0AAU6WRI7_9FLAO